MRLFRTCRGDYIICIKSYLGTFKKSKTDNTDLVK